MKKFRDRINKTVDLIIKNKRYFLAFVVLICIVLLLVFATDKPVENNDPMAGATDKYSSEISPELDALIRNYYKAYQSGDVDTIRTIANPLSDEEASYIQFYSQYLESFNDINIYTKRGLDASSLLVSVELNLKLKDIDTPAPGFDFFYVETDSEGKLFINNLYGSFNQLNSIYGCDAKVTTLIATFIQQQDVLEKQAAVKQSFDEKVAQDQKLADFVTTTLPNATVEWNTNYKAAIAQAEAEAAAAEAARIAEEEAARQAELEAQEDANAYTGKVTSKVRVRSEASTDSTPVGSLDQGKEVKIYSLEGDFYKIDFAGSKKYVSKDYIETAGPVITENGAETTTETVTDDNQQTDENNSPDLSGLEAGSEITLNSTCNIRSKMDSDSSKVAVAYAGEKVKIVMNYAEGWTKVKYGNKEGYIRTDLLTD